MQVQEILTILSTAAEIALFASVAVAPLVHAWNRTAPVPVQPVTTTPAPVVVEAEPEVSLEPVAAPVTEPDPWEAPTEIAPVPATVADSPAPTLYLLPPARTVTPNWQTLSPAQLRQECQRYGIRWRNARGRNRHMPTAEMRQRLMEVSALAEPELAHIAS